MDQAETPADAVGPVLLGWDDSEAAAEAIHRTASILPEPRRAVVAFAHVSGEGTGGLAPLTATAGTPVLSSAAADEILERGVLAAAEAGFEARGLRIPSRSTAGQAIIRAAETEDAKAIVLGQRQRSAVGRVLLGSVAREVVDGHHRPVIVVGHPAGTASTASGEAPGGAGPVILCWDGSPGAGQAIREARAILGPGRRAVVLFAHVPVEEAAGVLGGLSPPDAPMMGTTDAEVLIQRGVEAAGSADFEAGGRLVHATHKTAEIICELAAELDSPLIAMGQRQRSPIGTLLLGSVARGVLSANHRPVLLVGPGGSGPYPSAGV